jgi:sugar lactone lactonase YvrE
MCEERGMIAIGASGWMHLRRVRSHDRMRPVTCRRQRARLTACGAASALILIGCSAGSSAPIRGPIESPPSPEIPSIEFLSPDGLAVVSDGTLVITDCDDHRIYLVDTTGAVVAYGVGSAGIDNGFGGDGGPAQRARYSCPAGVALDGRGDIYVSDHGNNRVRMINASGIVATVAGSGPPGVNRGDYAGDGGQAIHARLSEPVGVAVGADGALYIADRDNAAVRRVAPNGIITTLAGTGVSGYSGDGGPGVRAELSDPENLVVDHRGRVFFTDQTNERVRMIGVDGTITTVAGTGDAGDAGDGGPATEATLNGPYGLAIDAAGNLYVADSAGARVRKIARDGTITTVAGTGVAGYAGDGGQATQAQLSQPSALAIDALGNLYIGDAGNGNVRMVDPQGTITTVITS